MACRPISFTGAVAVFAGAARACVAQVAAPDWVRVADHAAWTPRDSCGEVVHAGRMWLMGGWLNSNSIGPRDVWSSADGLNWDLVTETAGWEHGDLPTSLTFRDRMWFMGGWYAGRLPDASASSGVWSSADGARWECVTPAAGWSPRLGAGGAVFRDRMWVLGGVERYFDGEARHLKNDVWSSADGRTWEQVTAHAPWSPRAFHAAMAFRDRLWVFGGGNYLPGYLGYNDVWSSPDGKTWEQVTPAAAWAPRIWFSAVEYREHLWVLGGWSNNPSRNWNDVWYSADGKTWTELQTPTIWSPRHEQSFYVHQGRIWLVGGNAWPLVNDVWSLELPEEWP